MRDSPFFGRSTGAEPERDHPLDQRVRRLEALMGSEIAIDAIASIPGARTVQEALDGLAETSGMSRAKLAFLT